MIWIIKEVIKLAKKKQIEMKNDYKPIIVTIDGVEYERYGEEKVEMQNIAEATEEYSKLFGANKNLYRILPSLDGLRPGRRRLFYSWWDSDHRPSNTNKETLAKLRFHKVEAISATAMELHPHGSSASEELIGREGQYWSNNVMTIVPQGSYGNLQSADPAAGRYIQAKLSEYAIDCFFDHFDDYCIPMTPNYDDSKLEPEYLPTKYPHILFNAQIAGIGYGLASNIPAFNVKEVLEATIKLIKDPKAKVLLIPDFPNGANILDEGQFEDVNRTGKGKFTLQATAEIDYQKNTIRFTSLPIHMKTKQVILKILEFRKKHVFDEITAIDDSTKEGEVDLLIRLKSDANPDKVLEKLYKKKTGLRDSYPIGIAIVDDFKCYEYGISQLLLEWINLRRDDVRAMFLKKLQKVSQQEHINKTLLMIFNEDNIERTVKIARNSSSLKEIKEKLMRTYKISSLQATQIAEMKVHRFSKDSYKHFKEEKIRIKEELKEIEEILSDDKKIDAYIIKQLEEGIKKYGRPRMSKIVKVNDSTNKYIPNTEHLIGISESGYIKKLSLEDAMSIGPVGKTNGNISVMQLNNRENILVVDSTGCVSKISVSAIPDMKYNDIGIELARYFAPKGKIIGIMKLPSMDILKTKDENLCIVFLTKYGYGKKVLLSDFNRITDFKSGIALEERDELVAALFAFDKGKKDVIISTNKGNGVRLSIDDFRTYKRQAKGILQITLDEEEVITNASLMNPQKKLLFYITTSGRVKITETKYFPLMKRKDKPLSLLGLEGSESLVGIASVGKSDVVMVYRKNSDPVEVEIKDLKVSTRIAKAEKVIKTPKGDSVVAFKVFS